jgi:hypothetical protein
MFVTQTSEKIIQMKINMSLCYHKKYFGMSISSLSMVCGCGVINLVPDISAILCDSCLQLPFGGLSGKKCNFVSAHAAKAYKEFSVYFYTFLSSAVKIVGQPQRTICLTQGREYRVSIEY